MLDLSSSTEDVCSPDIPLLLRAKRAGTWSKPSCPETLESRTDLPLQCLCSKAASYCLELRRLRRFGCTVEKMVHRNTHSSPHEPTVSHQWYGPIELRRIGRTAYVIPTLFLPRDFTLTSEDRGLWLQNSHPSSVAFSKAYSKWALTQSTPTDQL